MDTFVPLKQSPLKRILLSALAFAAIPALAQTEIDSVIIQESRLQIPYRQNSTDIQILNRKDIEALPVKSVNELLAYAAATDVRQRGPWGTQADVNIDGSTFDEVLVLVNGIKLSDPQTGHHKMNLPIPLGAIERIEILRGPASRFYGVNALAGAINIVTRIATHNAVSVDAYAGSSFEQDTSNGKTYAGYGIDASGTLAAHNQAHTFSISRQQGNGYRYNTDYDNYRLYYGNTIKLNDKNSLRTLGAYTNNKFGASLFYAAPNDVEATETVQTALAGLSWIYQPNTRLRITPMLSYRYNKDDYIYIRQKPDVYHNIHETNVATAGIDASYRAGLGTVGLGVEWRSEQINSNSLGKRQRDNFGVYAGYEYRFSTRFSANAGVYLNHNSDFGTQLLPGVEAGYDLSNHLRLMANAGTGERQPTYTDLYYKGPANIGNDTLQAEQALYYEGTLQYHNSYGSLSASYGYRHVTNFIDWVRISEKDPWQPQNYAFVNTQILSLRGSYDLARSMRLPQRMALRLNLAYTHLEPTLMSSESLQTKYAIDALHNKVVLSLTSLFWNALELNVGARYQQRFNANEYWLLDARIAYHLHAIEVYADGNNLLNTSYYESGLTPLPGRWLTLGVKCSFLQ